MKMQHFSAQNIKTTHAHGGPDHFNEEQTIQNAAFMGFFSELTPALQQMNNGNDRHHSSHVSGLRCESSAAFPSHHLKKGPVASVTFRTARTFGHWLGTSSEIPRAVILRDGPELLRRTVYEISQATQGLPVSWGIYWGVDGTLSLFYYCGSGLSRTFVYRVNKWPRQNINRRSDPCFVAPPTRVPSCVFFDVWLGVGRDGQSKKLLICL